MTSRLKCFNSLVYGLSSKLLKYWSVSTVAGHMICALYISCSFHLLLLLQKYISSVHAALLIYSYRAKTNHISDIFFILMLVIWPKKCADIYLKTFFSPVLFCLLTNLHQTWRNLRNISIFQKNNFVCCKNMIACDWSGILKQEHCLVFSYFLFMSSQSCKSLWLYYCCICSDRHHQSSADELGHIALQTL